MNELYNYIINPANIFAMVVSFLIGWTLTHIYYIKSKPFEKQIKYFTHTIEEFIIKDKFENIFQSESTIYQSIEEKPGYYDVPFIRTFVCTDKKVAPGGKLTCLFRIIDMGMNFPGNEGINIENNVSNSIIGAIPEGFGWYSCIILVPKEANIGKFKITLKLADRDNNTSLFEYEYFVSLQN